MQRVGVQPFFEKRGKSNMLPPNQDHSYQSFCFRFVLISLLSLVYCFSYLKSQKNRLKFMEVIKVFRGCQLGPIFIKMFSLDPKVDKLFNAYPTEVLNCPGS
jgi:hypothetical protein